MARSSSNTKGKSSGNATASLNKLEKVAARVDFLAHEYDEELESKPARSNQPGRFKNPPEEHLGERLKEMRESKHITQGELAALTLSLDSEGKGVSRAVISLYEKGTDTGDLAHSQKLLAHKNRDMTEHYVKARMGERVKPLR